MKINQQSKILHKKSRQQRVRAKIGGTPERPRLCVFRSNVYIYAQLIDDVNGKTIVSASDLDVKSKAKKTERAKEVGQLLAKKAKEKNISEVVFDRAGYKYHGRVAALAEGARDGGLKF